MAVTIHWRWSCRINRVLCGRRSQPLCARVYARPDSLWRTAYLRACDVAFREPDHCGRVWRDWRERQGLNLPPIKERRGPKPGY